MHIPCRHIQAELILQLKNKTGDVAARGIHPKLLTILLGDAPDQLSYVNIKRKIAEEIGVGFEFLHIPKNMKPSEFKQILAERATEQGVTGVIVQQPLPQGFDTDSIYPHIPPKKDIEGQMNDDLYTFPLVQACMLGLSWAYVFGTKHREPVLSQYVLPFVPDASLIDWLKRKNITIAGNGLTTGQKLAHYFNEFNIPFHQTDSRTQNADDIYMRSDIIITGVGKNVLHRHNIKRGVILLNFGLRNELGSDGGSRLRGDYNEEDIRDIAQLYTKTPSGLGPIDVLCLYGNLLDAAEAQSKESR